MRKLTLKAFSLVLSLLIVFSIMSLSVFASNSDDASIIKEVSIYGVHTPYAGYRPDYGCKLSSSAYTFDNKLQDDPDVYMGRWWYDQTDQRALSPSDTFKENHVYIFTVLLVPSEGYEFRVDNYNTPFISATVNGEEASVYDELTGKHQAMIEYTFEPCEYNYEISIVEVNVEKPVAGGYPSFDAEILTIGVDEDTSESPYYINSVAWYDCINQTFLDPSHTFKEDGIYEVNVVLTTIGDYYFATKDGKAEVKAIINGEEGITETAGQNDKHHIRAARIVFGDIREEISYVEVTGVTSPVVGSTPDFDLIAEDPFCINGVYWKDITDNTYMKETDKFKANHQYELQVWIKANEDYKFSTDEDGYVDIAALVGGLQADVMLPGSEISAELSVTYTTSESKVISFVDVTEVNTPVAGEAPDYDAFCSTNGCNVSKVEWYDITDGKGVLINENSTFEEGRKYKVVVTVDAEGDYTYESDDMDVNIAEGNINGQKAIAYSSYDDKFLELGFEFAPCEIKGSDPSEPTSTATEAATTTEPSKPMEASTTTATTPTDETEPSSGNHSSTTVTSTDKTEPSASTSPSVPSKPVMDKGISGDVNGDGKVNIKDATQIQKHAAKLIELTDSEKLRADVNTDTKINIKDATAIQKFVAKIETGLPIGEKLL